MKIPIRPGEQIKNEIFKANNIFLITSGARTYTAEVMIVFYWFWVFSA
jgi:hypothetical protein